MKYVMLRVRVGKGPDALSRLVPIIFPNSINHDDMALFAAGACEASGHGSAEHTNAVSAGFVNLHVISTHDKSVTLGLNSDPGDAAVINMYDYFHGIEQ